MAQLIVGVGYKKDRGKDTFCDLLLNEFKARRPDLKVRKIGFADKLKDVAHQLYGWAGLKPGLYYDQNRAFKERVIDQLGKSPRQIYIELGNKLREIYEATWIDFALNGVDADVVLLKDMGFTNEARAVQRVGGVLVHIDRPGPNASDPRETELDTWLDWDFKVDNTGTIRDLALQVNHIYIKLPLP